MKVKDLTEILKNCDPEMDVFADVHDGLWNISKADVTEWYNESDLDKEDLNGENLEKALCLYVECSLPTYMP